MDKLTEAARQAHVIVLLDVTQAGWMDLRGISADFLIGAGHKWLMAPHGTAFMISSRSGRERAIALASGWTARADPSAPPWGNWQARRAGGPGLDQSPAFLPWIAQAASLAMIEHLGIQAVTAHDLGLARVFADRLGLPMPGTPIVVVPADPATSTALRRAGIQFTERSGKIRFSFHIHNLQADAELAADVVAAARSSQGNHAASGR